MDKFLIRKDAYNELIKAMRDRSHLVEKVITDKNGHQRKVLVRAGEDPKKQRTKKVEESTEKKGSFKNYNDYEGAVFSYGADGEQSFNGNGYTENDKKMIKEGWKLFDESGKDPTDAKSVLMNVLSGKNKSTLKPEEQKEKTDSKKMENVKEGNNSELIQSIGIGQSVRVTVGGNNTQGKVLSKGKDGIRVNINGETENVAWNKVKLPINKIEVAKGWRNGASGNQPESCDTLDGLLKTVESKREEFNKITDSIKQAFIDRSPLVFKRKTLKSETRIKEKLREDANSLNESGEDGSIIYDEKTDTYHCQTIRDCDGHTICVNNLNDLADIAEYLDGQSYVARFKNNFLKHTDAGYADLNLNIQLSDGVIVELQVNTTANMVAKEKYGHSLYEVYRSVYSKSEYTELKNLMESAQKSVYGLSNKYSLEGNYPINEIPGGNIYDENYKHEPYAAAIRQEINQAKELVNKAFYNGVLDQKTYDNFNHLVQFVG